MALWAVCWHAALLRFGRPVFESDSGTFPDPTPLHFLSILSCPVAIQAMLKTKICGCTIPLMRTVWMLFNEEACIKPHDLCYYYLLKCKCCCKLHKHFITAILPGSVYVISKFREHWFIQTDYWPIPVHSVHYICGWLHFLPFWKLIFQTCLRFHSANAFWCFSSFLHFTVR